MVLSRMELSRQLSPAVQAAEAAAAAGQRPHLRYAWHANATPHTMKPFGFHNGDAKGDRYGAEEPARRAGFTTR